MVTTPETDAANRKSANRKRARLTHLTLPLADPTPLSCGDAASD